MPSESSLKGIQKGAFDPKTQFRLNEPLQTVENSMISNETRVVIDQAKAIYERYREALEAEHRDEFMAIEPTSGDRFVADS